MVWLVRRSEAGENDPRIMDAVVIGFATTISVPSRRR
jgi:hypothetical protein